MFQNSKNQDIIAENAGHALLCVLSPPLFQRLTITIYSDKINKNIKKGYYIMKKFRIKTNDYTYAAIFAAIICISAWICIPAAPPFTMQVFAVSLCCGILGAKKAVLSLLIYMLLGAVGLPVFSGFRSGAAVLFGPTGGYVLGFLPFAVLSGQLCRRAKGLFLLILSLSAGLFACYTAGALWYSAFFLGDGGFWVAISYCVVPFILPDLIKIFLAALCIKKLKKSIY